MLDPDVVIRADEFAVRAGASGGLRGAAAVAGQAMARRASFARLALVDGAPGAVVVPRGKLVTALEFAVIDGKITEIEVIADPARLRSLDLAVIGAWPISDSP